MFALIGIPSTKQTQVLRDNGETFVMPSTTREETKMNNTPICDAADYGFFDHPNLPYARVMLKSEGQKLECALAKMREENSRLKRHLIFQDDADKDPQAVYDVVRRDEIKKLREQLAAVKKILEMEVEISTKAICIMDGNAPRIDYADQAQPELLRKLCEHLLAWDEVVKGKGILEYSLAAITRERDQLREQYNTLVTARNTAFDILGGQP